MAQTSARALDYHEARLLFLYRSYTPDQRTALLDLLVAFQASTNSEKSGKVIRLEEVR